MASVTRWSATIHERVMRMLTCAQLAALGLRQEEGVSAVEYVIIAAVVLVVVFAAIKGFFGAVASKFKDLTKTVSGS